MAICDSTSLHEKGLIACDMIYPHFTTEIFRVLHNPDKRWYCLREQKREVLLMRNYGPNGALGKSFSERLTSIISLDCRLLTY